MKILDNKAISKYISNKNIAVVGSSPNLIGQGKGDLIDSHDIVIRFNDALIYYDISNVDFGSKCDVWAISGWSKEYDDTQSLQKHINTLEEKKPIILGTRPLQNNNMQQLSKGLVMRGPVFDLISKRPFEYINTPQEIFDLSILEGNFNLSSGLAAILLLIHYNPKKLSLFGFNFFNYNMPTHFWEEKFLYTKEMKENSIGHNGDFESSVINSLIQPFNINTDNL